MTAPQQAAVEKNVFRKTNAHAGRHVFITPGNSSMRHLCVRPHPASSSKIRGVLFNGRSRDRTHLSLGQGRRSGGSESHRNWAVRCDLRHARCFRHHHDQDRRGPCRVFRDVDNRLSACSRALRRHRNGPGLKFSRADRIARGTCKCCWPKTLKPGGSSPESRKPTRETGRCWPPHETLRSGRGYVYFDMPEPAYGISWSTTTRKIRNCDRGARWRRRAIPNGYHPNVSVPGHRICFLWAMAAHREVTDRQFGVVNVQPGFKQDHPAWKPPQEVVAFHSLHGPSAPHLRIRQAWQRRRMPRPRRGINRRRRLFHPTPAISLVSAHSFSSAPPRIHGPKCSRRAQ